jgi:hypothetical protein
MLLIVGVIGVVSAKGGVVEGMWLEKTGQWSQSILLTVGKAHILWPQRWQGGKHLDARPHSIMELDLE